NPRGAAAPAVAEPSPASHAAKWIAIALAAAVILIYAPVMNHGFITLDDPEYITENPYIAQGFTWDAIVWAFTSGYQFYWHPLTWMTHMLDIQLFGVHAGMHHIANVLLHIANSILCFFVFLRLTRALWPSAFVAALFAVHPLRVESVAWVAERKDVLSTCLGLLTLLAYARYAQSRGQRPIAKSRSAASALDSGRSALDYYLALLF